MRKREKTKSYIIARKRLAKDLFFMRALASKL